MKKSVLTIGLLSVALSLVASCGLRPKTTMKLLPLRLSRLRVLLQMQIWHLISNCPTFREIL